MIKVHFINNKNYWLIFIILFVQTDKTCFFNQSKWTAIVEYKNK